MDISDSLQSKLALFTKRFLHLHPHLARAVRRILCGSDYAGRQFKHLRALLEQDDCHSCLSFIDYQRLVLSISLDSTSTVFAEQLRFFRHRHLLRLVLRECAGFSSTAETISAWSDCADALLLHTLYYCEQSMTERYGYPRDKSQEKSSLYILAMGKLGGRELNFSSDIDLIFAYSREGNTDGKESISNQQYFSKVIQKMVSLFQNKTVDGFVFRVDLRLRPNGDSGPLVYPLAAMETYYQEQGRDWERYAMVKARPVGTNIMENPPWFQRLIMPFVYRRYVDFSVIESLRSMKGMIEREVQLNPMLDDIKRGKGGIREVEFIVQCIQLIRGGRLPHIQTQNALLAMSALHEAGLLNHAGALKQAYLFLRQLENALQLQNDQQTHSLPLETTKKAQVSLLMGYETWDDVVEKLRQYQRIINRAFSAILGQVEVYQDEKKLVPSQLMSIWQGHVEERMAVHLLQGLHFKDAERCFQMLYVFRHSPRCRRLSQAVRMRLDRFMVLLLSNLCSVGETAIVLVQVLNLLENIVGRSAYLALLSENPSVLQEVLHWFAHSPFITSLMIHQPFLLEVLIDQGLSWQPPSRQKLKQLLQEQLLQCVDEERHGDILRQFKLTCWLSGARAELYDKSAPLRIGKFLADVAEVILEEVLAKACIELETHYPEIRDVKSRFAVLVYGKLGSREMNYDSDLDLVFLHTVSFKDEGLVTRLTQKILHKLTTRTQTGILYAVDTRLRPSGAAGLLVSHLDAFTRYQKTNAWTWEHQAILRARLLFAHQHIQRVLRQLKRDILHLPRDVAVVKGDILKIRKKIGEHIEGNGVKYVRGGLLDLEFLVQFLILAYPSVHFVRLTNTLQQLEQLQAQNTITDVQFAHLKQAHQHYHRLLHRGLLTSECIISDEHQANVVAISKCYLSS